MAEYWWRSWHGAPMDHKWPVIAARAGVVAGVVSAIAWELLDYASQQPERGSIVGFDVETYAFYSGFSETQINAVIQAMTDKQVIVDGKFANWDKRQPKSEKEIQRVTEWRKSKKKSEEKEEVLRSVTESYTDTDTDTDTELINASNDASEQPDESQGGDEMQYRDPVWDLLHGETPEDPQDHGPDVEWATEETRELAGVFLTSSRLPVPMKKTEKSFWIKSLQEMTRQGVTGELLKAAVDKMRGDGLTIKGPNSVQAVALDIKAKRVTAAGNGGRTSSGRLLPEGV